MKSKTQSQPENYIPRKPSEFIGGAHRVAVILKGKAQRLISAEDSRARLLFYGQPGVGKTKLAEYFASLLTAHVSQIEQTNGRNITVELIRQWQDAARYLSIFGKWSVKIVDELDTCPFAAQDLLLTYLDKMPPFTAFVGTSNLDLTTLADRFQTRFQQFKIEAPETDEINRLLGRFRLNDTHVNQIGVGCGGNVRAALLDAQSILDARAA